MGQVHFKLVFIRLVFIRPPIITCVSSSKIKRDQVHLNDFSRWRRHPKEKGAKRIVPKLCPLESVGAANKRILQFTHVYSRLFKVKALMAHQDNMLLHCLISCIHAASCADSALFIIPDEHT